jgi:chitosanase
VDPLTEKIAKAIVNIFETGRLLGNYGRVTVAAGDPGHLSYGRSQATLASGNLFVLINRYCSSPGAAFGSDLTPYLPRLQACDVTLDNDTDFKNLLSRAGADPVMQQAQDAFFDNGYWQPANRTAATIPLKTPLGITTIYDSKVHGHCDAIVAATAASFAGAAAVEPDWVARYIAIRRAWLANNPKVILRACVYRMDELQKLVDTGKWNLDPPLTVRGITITAQSFGAAAADAESAPPVHASAQDADEATLSLQVPYLRGTAVELLQHALAREGLLPESAIDGVFGPLTATLVKQFQANHGLTADGIVGPATWSIVHDVMAA